MTLEKDFDATFTARLALREKQIQQNYRPIIGVHKWFARRPGTVFRNLFLAEFNGTESIASTYWRAHTIRGVIADPFMGGGTPIYEANRLGFSVVGTDINPMAYWIVRQSLAPLDTVALIQTAESVVIDVDREIGSLYETTCATCSDLAPVKYFIWVKVESCPSCGTDHDLFPGYLLAEAVRHPKHVVICGWCGTLNECAQQPSVESPAHCKKCNQPVFVEGPARRNRIECRACGTEFRYPRRPVSAPPRHRMWAIEYHCPRCKPQHKGRFFKSPEKADLLRFEHAQRAYGCEADLPIPNDTIPPGDETDRLHRWGYRRYREMFNERQLLSLGLLLRRINRVEEPEIRKALLTIFSDFLRYQNMLCRYDTYALKCQDIFSVHGFPVGLVQCENNVLGIPKVGSGAFRHFVEKYVRAKQYCAKPFETRQVGSRNTIVHIEGERIGADFVDHLPSADRREALLLAAPAVDLPLKPATLDGVFTDPPYFDNVQYAELMDFCFSWLRLGLNGDSAAFEQRSTRNDAELTGNETLGRGVEHFTDGLSKIFCHYSRALKPGAPFVFTYHHNDPAAYAPLVVAILDAGLDCTATLPAPAEMGASLHIAGTSSSVLDSIFVCRLRPTDLDTRDIETVLLSDIAALQQANLRLTVGDVRCLLSGHVARSAINVLQTSWDRQKGLAERIAAAREMLMSVSAPVTSPAALTRVLGAAKGEDLKGVQLEAPV